jgi:hypothetical protein
MWNTTLKMRTSNAHSMKNSMAPFGLLLAALKSGHIAQKTAELKGLAVCCKLAEKMGNLLSN